MVEIGPLLILAQTGEQSAAILRWLLVIAALAAVIVVVAVIVRRRLMADEEEEDAGPGFMLADLRRLHREGQLSDEEFATAKAAMIARSRALLHEDETGPANEDRPFPTDVGEVEPEPGAGDGGEDDGNDAEGESDKSEPH
jgi:hypothetical protein